MALFSVCDPIIQIVTKHFSEGKPSPRQEAASISRNAPDAKGYVSIPMEHFVKSSFVTSSYETTGESL